MDPDDLYILAILVVVAVVPWTVTAQGGVLDASPFVKVFSAAGIPAAAGLMNFVVLLRTRTREAGRR